MAQVAAWLKSLGKAVTGSDQGVYPPMSTFLEAQGISILSPFKADHIKSADCIVVGNAMSRGNPEVEAALDQRLPLISLPQLIHQEILKHKLPAVVSGTHGKTTTTAALAFLLEAGEQFGGSMVGGLPTGWDSGFRIADGSWFAIEGDEYDTAFFDKRPKFLHYQPQLVIINNIEFDHADIYGSYDDILKQFKLLVRLIPQSGCLVLNADQPNLKDLTQDAFCQVVTYGRSEASQVRGSKAAFTADGMEFTLRFKSGESRLCRTALWGNHQLSNLIAASAAAEFVGVSADKIVHGISSFKGVRRRLELRHHKDNYWIYDDFAHHPTAIRFTLETLRKRHPDLPLIAAFEPRSNTMVRKRLEKELINALSLADAAAIGPIHRSDKIPQKDRLSLEHILKSLRDKSITNFQSADVDELADRMISEAKNGAVFAVMSSGSFMDLINKLISCIQDK